MRQNAPMDLSVSKNFPGEIPNARTGGVVRAP